MVFSEFKKDKKTQDAVVKQVETVGEAVKKLSEDLKKSMEKSIGVI